MHKIQHGIDSRDEEKDETLFRVTFNKDGEFISTEKLNPNKDAFAYIRINEAGDMAFEGIGASGILEAQRKAESERELYLSGHAEKLPSYNGEVKI